MNQFSSFTPKIHKIFTTQNGQGGCKYFIDGQRGHLFIPDSQVTPVKQQVAATETSTQQLLEIKTVQFE